MGEPDDHVIERCRISDNVSSVLPVTFLAWCDLRAEAMTTTASAAHDGRLRVRRRGDASGAGAGCARAISDKVAS